MSVHSLVHRPAIVREKSPQRRHSISAPLVTLIGVDNEALRYLAEKLLRDEDMAGFD